MARFAKFEHQLFLNISTERKNNIDGRAESGQLRVFLEMENCT